jgi:hypothetical protein
MNKRTRKNGILSIKLIAILFAMSALHVSAKTPYEFSVYAGGGYSFFVHRLSMETVPTHQGYPRHPEDYVYQRAVNGVSSTGSAGDLGIGFTGFITPQVGLHVGLGLSLYNIGVKVDSLKTFTSRIYEDEEKNYTNNLFSTLSDYRETHRTFNLSVPFMIQFQTMESQTSSWKSRRAETKQGFYAMTGIKLNVLLSNTYESKVATLFNAEHNPELNNWANTQEFANLGKFRGKNAKGDFGFIQAIFALEAGMKWRIADNMYLYTGAYLEYGLNDPARDNRISTSSYISPDDELGLLEFSEQTNLMAIGIKLRLAFIRYNDQLSCPQF